MKSRLLFSIVIISFLGVNTSKAQEIQSKIAPSQIETGISRKASFNLEGSWDSTKNWLKPKTEPPSGNLACPNP
jgi:hypothetical protein